MPDLLPALPLFAQLRRFTLAVIAAAETAADFAGILYTDAPASGEADAAEPFEPIELEKRALVTMPGGWKMSQLQAEQPSTGYAEFKHEILNEIARCLNMPFNVAAGNSSGYNYASGRLDHQTYFKAIRVEQVHLEAVVLDRILAAWFDEAALIPGLLPAGLGPIGDWPHQWFWDGHEHVDPAKEATAQATRLANLTTTLADEYARRGLDWEAQLRQRAKELASVAATRNPDGTVTPEDDHDEGDALTVEAVRAQAIAETNRITAVRRVCAGRFPEIESQAIRDGWDAMRTELEVLRSTRPRSPGIGSGDGGVSGAVLEAACLLTAKLDGVERLYPEQTLEQASRRFRGGIGLQELLLEAAWANGYTGRNFRDHRTVLRYAFGRGIEAAFSTVDIGGILSNVANKFLLDGFFSVERTWRNVCAVRNVSDFKTVTSYRLVGKDQ